jgi:hypothetical protein
MKIKPMAACLGSFFMIGGLVRVFFGRAAASFLLASRCSQYAVLAAIAHAASDK